GSGLVCGLSCALNVRSCCLAKSARLSHAAPRSLARQKGGSGSRNATCTTTYYLRALTLGCAAIYLRSLTPTGRGICVSNAYRDPDDRLWLAGSLRGNHEGSDAGNHSGSDSG